jgi:hypothetical protein
MSDDFQLFPDRPHDGEQLDADLSLITAYLAHELSPVQVAAVERRLSADPSFAAATSAIVGAWNAPVSDRWSTGDVSAIDQGPTASEVDAGWKRFEASEEPSVWGSARARAFAKAAVIVLLLAGPVFAIAQGIRHMIERSRPQTGAVPAVVGGPLVVGESAKDAGRELAVVPRSVVPPAASAGPEAAGPPAGVVPQGQLRIEATPFVEILTSATARVRGMVRFSDGSLAVATAIDSVRSLIGLFRPTGVLRVAFSSDRLALGPNESISGIYPYRGDSIFVLVGSTAGTLTGSGGAIHREMQVTGLVLDANGAMGRRVSMRASTIGRPNAMERRWSTPPGRGTGFQGTLADGSFILRGETVALLTGSPGGRQGRAMFWRASPDGTAVDTIGTFVVDEIDEIAATASGGAGPGYVRSLFTPQAPRAGVFGTSIYLGDGRDFEITVLDLAGFPAMPPKVRALRAARELRFVMDSDWREEVMTQLFSATLRANIRAGTGRTAQPDRDSLRIALTDSLQKLPRRPTLPAYVGVIVDAGGNIWLEHYRLLASMPARAEPARWTVLSPSGTTIGDVVMPDGFVPTAIGLDWVLGAHRRSGGPDRVQMYKLTR